jgi:precorrin-6A/cobalt-precorrin-6A reductase
VNGRVLLLGGTGEARRLAAALVADGVDVVSSLAGATADPLLPAGEVRIGGFGGAAGLTAWLRAEGVTAVVDATHPFAAAITGNAVAAAAGAGVALLRLQRPGWTAGPGDDWRWVGTLAEAAAAVSGFARVFLTTGRRGSRPSPGCPVRSCCAPSTRPSRRCPRGPRWCWNADRSPWTTSWC